MAIDFTLPGEAVAGRERARRSPDDKAHAKHLARHGDAVARDEGDARRAAGCELL